MPKNHRESLIYTVLMCFVMVLWMSVYNVAMLQGELSFAVVQQAWLGFPIAYVFAMCCDWFFVSKIAKGFAFRFLVKPGVSSPRKMVIAVSCCMAVEASVHTGAWAAIPMIWLTNIPKNFIMALPFQLIIAGPLVRLVFRRAFPEGTVAG